MPNELRFDSALLAGMGVRQDEAEAMIRNNPHVHTLYNQRVLNANFSLQSARELDQIKKTLYYTQFPEFLADKLCPVSNENHTGAKTVGYDMLDPTGMAEVGDDNNDDIPEANIKKEQVTQPVVTIRQTIKWNIQDLREAVLAQQSGLSASFSFTQEKTRALLLAIKRKEEDIFVRGDSKYNVPGFCNNSNVGAVTLTSSSKWQTATPKQIVKSLNELLNGVSTASKNVFRADTVLLPPTLYDIVASEPYEGSNGTASETILSFWLKTRREINPGFKVVNYPYLELVASSSQWRIIAYKRDPMILTQEIPQPLETFGPFTKNSGLNFQVIVRERHAGVQLRYDNACKYALINKT